VFLNINGSFQHINQVPTNHTCVDQFDSEIKISDKNVSGETINLFHDAAAADPKYKEISQAADKLLGAIVQKQAGINNEVVINSVTENGTVIIRACIDNRK
jgi:primase-polymerase (primpol)-like protein